MVIDVSILTKWLAFIVEVATIILGIYTYIRVKIIGRIEKVEKAVEELQKDAENFNKEMNFDKEERIIIIKALSACLDGLSQLGANHSVPENKKALDDFLLKRSHE